MSSMNHFKAFMRLTQSAPKKLLMTVLMLMVIGIVTESFGLLLLIPLLEVLSAGQGLINTKPGMLDTFRTLLDQVGIGVSIESLLLLFVCLAALRGITQMMREKLSSRLQHEVIDTLRLRCFRSILSVEWRWFLNTKSADHGSLLLSNIGRIGLGLHAALSLIVTLGAMVAYFMTAAFISFKLTLIAISSAVFVYLLLHKQRDKVLTLGRGLTKSSQALFSNVQESLASIKLAKILGSEDLQFIRMKETLHQLSIEMLSFVESSSRSRAVFQFLGAALLATYLYLGIVFWATPWPVLITLVFIFSRLIPSFMSAHQQFEQWLYALPAFTDTEKLLYECDHHTEDVGSNASTSFITSLKKSIQLKKVSLTYEGRNKPALSNITLNLPAYKTTAVIGRSGAGKSTLADMLIGLLEPDQGAILIDGIPLSASNRKLWRQKVAYVSQDIFLSHDTIRNNLTWGKTQVSDAQLKDALKRASADFVFKLPKGLNTVVGDGGIRLSGGERQRIALARALLRDPWLLILDEATSALDRDNEARIMDSIEKLHGGYTVLMIGHRLLRLDLADQVIVLDEGKVLAEGPWKSIEKNKLLGLLK